MQVDTLPNESYSLANLLHFVQLLRRVGINTSNNQVFSLLEGLRFVDLSRKDDFYNTLRCFLLLDHNQLDIFNQAFDLFWKGQISLLVELGTSHAKTLQPVPWHELPLSEQDARQSGRDLNMPYEQPEADETAEIKATAIYSPAEVLSQKDFASFSEEEIEIARRLFERLNWRAEQRLTRRKIHSVKRRRYLDLRATLRSNLASNGEIISLSWKRRKSTPRPLVVICDVSGSMESYSRLFLHFIYTLARHIPHLEVFVFGTRLTRITPELKHGSLDTTLKALSDLVMDWSGGTRIGAALKTYNYLWARRMLNHRAVVVIISDGWDRGELDLLKMEISRLQRSSWRLIWLNPLMGTPGYQPLVGGIKTILPYVHDCLPLSKINDLQQFATKLGILNRL